MNNVVDEVLASSPRYNIKDNNGNVLYSGTIIELATAITTAGTPLNKALFDSIQSDLTNLENNKLNTSSKATTYQAQVGTNDTNYMTPKKTRDEIKYLTETRAVTVTTSSGSQPYTLVDVSSLASDVAKVIITGTATGGTSSNYTSLNINGTFGRKWERDVNGAVTATASEAPTQWRNNSSNSYPFRIEMDLKSKCVFYSYTYYTNSFYTIDGMAIGAITSVGGTLRGHSGSDSTLNATIQYIID